MAKVVTCIFSNMKKRTPKNQRVNKVVDGIIYDLVSAEDENRQMTLAVVKEEGEYKI